MLTSIALLFLTALLLGYAAQKLRLPALIGIILTGILLGPDMLNLIEGEVLEISPALRKMALVIILLRAGLSLSRDELRRAGISTLFMAFLPACFEIVGVLLLAPPLLGLSIMESALLGCVVAAVSPAVVVPKMLQLMQEKYGTRKSIPQMIMAAGSIDDVIVIILFSLFLNLNQGEGDITSSLVAIPSSILGGLALGLGLGYCLSWYFKKVHLRDTTKVLILLSCSFLLLTLEEVIAPYVVISGLLGIMFGGFFINFFYPILAQRLSVKFQKLWVAAEIILFVLVGAVVNLSYVQSTGLQAVLLIAGIWCFRMLGVFVALLKSELNFREKIFCMIAYSPKATVQAAIGAIPLAMGLPSGNVILTVAILSILITAPLGALGIEWSYKRLLSNDGKVSQ